MASGCKIFVLCDFDCRPSSVSMKIGCKVSWLNTLQIEAVTKKIGWPVDAKCVSHAMFYYDTCFNMKHFKDNVIIFLFIL